MSLIQYIAKASLLLRAFKIKKIQVFWRYFYGVYHRIYFCLTYDLILSGRGPDIDNPSNLNINDVLGDYSLTLIDSLDTLAIMGNVTEFKKAVKLVVDNVSFDKPYTVQVSDS